MEYKVVPFVAAVSNMGDASNVAAQIEGIISRFAADGYELVGVYQLQTSKAGSNGCFGLGAVPGSIITSEFIVFRKS